MFIASPEIKAFKNATWSITISKIYLGITVFYSLVREKLLSFRRGDFNDWIDEKHSVSYNIIRRTIFETENKRIHFDEKAVGPFKILEDLS